MSSVSRSYEMIALFSPKKQQQDCFSALEEIFSRHDVKVTKDEKWGEKSLPHLIKDIDKAFFLYKCCQIIPEKLSELSRDLRLDAHILRFMFKRLN